MKVLLQQDLTGDFPPYLELSSAPYWKNKSKEKHQGDIWLTSVNPDNDKHN